MTALELGGRGDEYPLALAQMRDAVEHLRRVDLLETFPPRLPRRELLATFFVLLVAGLVGISPNPWILRARASNPAITAAREQAQRVERLADSIRTEDSPELDPLQELLRKRRTIDARANDPGEALTARRPEEQVQQMSAATISLPPRSPRSPRPGRGPEHPAARQRHQYRDLREISKAAKDLAQQTISCPAGQRRVSRRATR